MRLLVLNPHRRCRPNSDETVPHPSKTRGRQGGIVTELTTLPFVSFLGRGEHLVCPKVTNECLLHRATHC